MARYVLDVNELAGVTAVLIEHDMGVVMDISDARHGAGLRPLHRRRQPARGPQDPAVIKAYLGEAHVRKPRHA